MNGSASVGKKYLEKKVEKYKKRNNILGIYK
jgi:hypothetical protein